MNNYGKIIYDSIFICSMCFELRVRDNLTIAVVCCECVFFAFLEKKSFFLFVFLAFENLVRDDDGSSTAAKICSTYRAFILIIFDTYNSYWQLAYTGVLSMLRDQDLVNMDYAVRCCLFFASFEIDRTT